MNRESRILAENLLQHLPEVDKALDVLAAHNVTTYSLLLLQEGLFDPTIAESKFGEVQNKSDFLAGAFAVLAQMSSLPEALESIRKELDKKK